MSEEKLSSDEVPEKFAEWLLAMGCPPENVPSVDKIAEKCRGQYYMVWRSLMERVEPKDAVTNKRLQVFCEDIKNCQKKNIFNERETTVVVPQELALWSQHSQLKEKVAEAELRVTKEKENLQLLMDKISSKLAHRNLSRKRLADAQRRVWLLSQVAEELREKRANLLETKTITHSLCGLNDGADIESKVDKCVSTLSRSANASKSGASMFGANPAACSSIASTNGDGNDEEQITSLVKCRGDVLFKQLYEKRAGLCAAIPPAPTDTTADKHNRISPQAVLSHTAALQCTLALEAMKNRVHIRHTRSRLATAVNELSDYLSGEACELLVLRCERALREARVGALQSLCEDVSARSGAFATGAHQILDTSAKHSIRTVDKAIESKRDELKRLITSAEMVERKTQNVKECLVSLFSSFHDDRVHDIDRFGGRSSFPQESISNLRQFYEERRERRKNKMELSLCLDLSDDCSFSDPTDSNSPKFVDELKLYLKKFHLEKNRKLVLDSGEKVWIFETVHSSLHQLHAKWQNKDTTTSLLCPSVNLKRNLRNIAQRIADKALLEEMICALENGGKRNEMNLEISPITDEEQKILDRIKKRLNENILNLQKTNKTLDVGMENLGLWSDNCFKQYISDLRTVNGRTYKGYEDAYLESLRI